MKAHRWWLTGILAAALAARLLWVLRLPEDQAAFASLPDQLEYLQLGQNLLRGEGLKFHDARFNDDVFAYRMPGYPAMIAICGGNVLVIRIAQALLDVSTILAVYLLSRRWLDERASLLAALPVACNPFLIYFCGLILSETLFIAMLAWGMCLLVNVRSGAALAGLTLLALSIHVRPSGLLLPIIAPLFLTKRWHFPLIGGVLIVLVLLPWAMRNQRVLGQRIWTTTNGGVTLYDGFNPSADGSSNQSFLESMPELQTFGEIERSEYLSARAQDYIMSHRGRVMQLTIRKIARTWSPIPLSGQFGSNRLYVIAGGGFSVVLFVLTAAGLWIGKLPARGVLFLLLPAMYFTAVHAASVGSLRYRIPADVPMSIIAAAGAFERTQVLGTEQTLNLNPEP